MYDADTVVSDYLDFLKIPTISADPSHKEDVLKGARWVEDYLKESGLEVDVWETPGYPVVFGEWKGAKGAPTLLIYGHYDVQPVDPLELWSSDPFDPTVRDGQVYARGAQDNKGQILYTMAAIRALLKKGDLGVNLKICVEGEEEVKSVGFSKILHNRAEELKADYLLIPDFDVPSLEKPAVTLGLRGMAAITIDLVGSRADLHSGAHGGVVFNPNHALVQMLAGLRDSEGRVTVEGFYDGVVEPEEKELISFATEFETPTTGGEKGVPPGERVTIRPTLEINGLSGGYAGPGFKTVIPARAHAKISCRLVPNQDPAKILVNLKKKLEELCPDGIEMTITDHGGGRAVRSSANVPLAKVLKEAYEEVFEKPCVFQLSGGSVPISAELGEVCGAPPVYMGLGLHSDDIHAPDEHFGLDRLELGFRVIQQLLERLK